MDNKTGKKSDKQPSRLQQEGCHNVELMKDIIYNIQNKGLHKRLRKKNKKTKFSERATLSQINQILAEFTYSNKVGKTANLHNLPALHQILTNEYHLLSSF